MTLDLMLHNDDDNYLQSTHYVPNTALCALYGIYLIFTRTPGNRSYSIFTQDETEGDRGDKDNSSTQLIRHRAVINSTSFIIPVWD